MRLLCSVGTLVDTTPIYVPALQLLAPTSYCYYNIIIPYNIQNIIYDTESVHIFYGFVYATVCNVINIIIILSHDYRVGNNTI